MTTREESSDRIFPDATMSACRIVCSFSFFCFTIAVAGMMSPVACRAADRVLVVEPSSTEEAVKTLTSSLESACNKRDVLGFLSQFTPKQAAKIRRSIEDLFICHDVELKILDTLILSSTDTSIVFGVRYTWHGGRGLEHQIAARVNAKKVGDAWMVDGEEILSRTASMDICSQGEPPFANALVGPLPRQDRPDWIPSDVGWVQGGCANGRCGL